MRRFLSRIIVLFFVITCIYAQSEDSDWFWNHTITKIEFEGLRTVKKSELTGVTSSFIGQPFTEELYSDMLDRLYALDFFEEIEPYANHDKNPENIL